MEELEFINREREIDYIIDGYTNYILIVAPLGYGKSVLIKNVAKRLYKKNYEYIDIEVKENIQLEQLKDYLEHELKCIKNSDNIYITIDDINATSKNIIEDFINKTVLNLENRFKEIKVVLTSRNIKNRLNLERRFVERKIKPFNLDVIKETTRNYLKKNGKDADINLIYKLSYNILYYTGGHPKCVGTILKDIVNSRDMNLYFNNKKRIFDIVERYSTKIYNNLDKDIQNIIPILSPIRRFNTQTLKTLISENLINYNGNIYDLEDKLTKTKIIERKDSFLQDDIIRKLLAINFRNHEHKNYLKIISKAKDSYIYIIKNGLTIFPHLLGIELIFLEIEDRLERAITNSKDDIYKLFKFTIKLLTGNESNDRKLDIKRVFVEQLKRDRELEFIINFYINRDKSRFIEEYGDIIERLEDE